MMKMRWHQFTVMILLGLAAPSSAEEDSPGPAAPSGLALVQKMIERAETRKKANPLESYVYRLVRVREELDRKGDVEERKELTYEVTVSGGDNERRLLLINGQPLPAERAQEERRRASDRNEAPKHPTSGTQSVKLLTTDLTGKLDFHFEKMESVGGRPCYLVNFKPAADPPRADSFMDRILAHVYGNFWIDAEDYELAKLEVRLGGPARFWGGILASLKTLEVSLVRQRSEEGVWYLESSRVLIHGRALVKPIRLRVTESAGDLRKGEDAPIAEGKNQEED